MLFHGSCQGLIGILWCAWDNQYHVLTQDWIHLSFCIFSCWAHLHASQVSFVIFLEKHGWRMSLLLCADLLCFSSLQNAAWEITLSYSQGWASFIFVKREPSVLRITEVKISIHHSTLLILCYSQVHQLREAALFTRQYIWHYKFYCGIALQVIMLELLNANCKNCSHRLRLRY